MDKRIITIQQFYDRLNAENDISGLGSAIEFYIATGYDEMLSLDEISKELKNFANNQPTKADFSNYFDNVITNGYLTHSFNGYMLNHYRKNGIGAKLEDPELTENFAILEKYIGISHYVARYAKEIPEFYVTSPGNNSIYYALLQSPERLWHGPLSQRDEEHKVLPIVGETKSQYAMRIIESKINKRNLTNEEAEEVRKAAKILLEKLCTTNPMIAFIPISKLMDSYVLKSGIFYKSLGDISEMDYVREKGKTLREYLNAQDYYDASKKQVDTTFFCKHFGGDWDRSELDDISVLGTIIPFDEVELVEFEDSFSAVQRMLKQGGVADGTPFKFDEALLTYYYYGQQKEITESNNQEKSSQYHKY